MCIYCDYCVYHYKSTELVSLYTLDIGLEINIFIIIIITGKLGIWFFQFLTNLLTLLILFIPMWDIRPPNIHRTRL